MNVIDVIVTKRDGHELSTEQIDWVLDAYTRGVVADEQMSSLAMAILLNGMTRREIAEWTQAMIRSGSRMDWSALPGPTTDKHSTGGVGDKITLPLAPLVAACGGYVPQLSGRGSATPAAPWTSWSPSPAGRRPCPTTGCSTCSGRPARSSARPETGWPRRTRSSTRCATSPAPSSRSR